MTLETRMLDGAGVSLACDVGGPEEGQPVILLHGGGQTRHSWGPTANALIEAGYGLLSIDLRGHGQSDWSPGGDYGVDRFVDDLAALARPLAAPPFLVGASLGGLIGLLYAGERHASVAGLVLVDVAPTMDTAEGSRIAAFMRAHTGGFETLEAAARSIADFRPDRPPPANLEGLKKNLRQREDGRFYWHWDPRIAGDAMTEDMAPLSRRLRQAAGALRTPTLLIKGERSRVVTEDSVADFLRLVPHGEVLRIARAGHMLVGDDNGAFAKGVRAFLRRHARPSAHTR